MADLELKILGDLASLKIGPGRIPVIMTDQQLSLDEKSHLRNEWKRIFPGVKVLLLENGMRIGVIEDETDAP